MFDDLRDLSDSESSLYEDEKNELYKEPSAGRPATPVAAKPIRRKSHNFLGMTAQQRFIIAFMIMFTVCILGTLAMFVTGSMSLL